MCVLYFKFLSTPFNRIMIKDNSNFKFIPCKDLKCGDKMTTHDVMIRTCALRDHITISCSGGHVVLMIEEVVGSMTSVGLLVSASCR